MAVARSLAGAHDSSYVWSWTVRGFFSWRSRADVSAGRFDTRSGRRRRSARAIAGVGCANILAAEPGRSARFSARKMSPCPVRSATTFARPTAARPCIGASARNAARRCSARRKSGRRSLSFAQARSTIPIWRCPPRPSGPLPRPHGRASIPICPRSRAAPTVEGLTGPLALCRVGDDRTWRFRFPKSEFYAIASRVQNSTRAQPRRGTRRWNALLF
jgi:hypothetical protein